MRASVKAETDEACDARQAKLGKQIEADESELGRGRLELHTRYFAPTSQVVNNDPSTYLTPAQARSGTVDASLAGCLLGCISQADVDEGPKIGDDIIADVRATCDRANIVLEDLAATLTR